MFYATHLIGFAAGAAGITFSFQGSKNDGTDATTYNLTPFDLGTEDATRRILVAVGYGDGSETATLDSMTVNSVSASVLSGTHVRNGTSNVAFWIADVPTGTTGVTISLTFSGAVARVAIGAYAIYDAAGTASDTVTSTASPLSFSSIVKPDGAAVFATAYKFNSTSGFVWTGLTEDFDADVEVDSISSASSLTPGATIEASLNGAGSDPAGCAVAIGLA